MCSLFRLHVISRQLSTGAASLGGSQILVHLPAHATGERALQNSEFERRDGQLRWGTMQGNTKVVINAIVLWIDECRAMQISSCTPAPGLRVVGHP